MKRELSSVGLEHLPYKQRVVGSIPTVPTGGIIEKLVIPFYSYLMAFTYILYSYTLNKYYIGSTHNTMEERLEKHLTNHDGFTAKAKDWKVVYTEHFDAYEKAAEKEKSIKGWKSRKMIEKLIKSLNALV